MTKILALSASLLLASSVFAHTSSEEHKHEHKEHKHEMKKGEHETKEHEEEAKK